MKQTFEYGSYSYEYFIEFSDRKSLTLIVRPDLRIIARVPDSTTIDEIEKFLTRKWKWLENRLAEFRKYSKSHYEKKYVSGEAFHYLGRLYTLEVESSSNDIVKLERGRLRVYTSKSPRNSAHNKSLVDAWYTKRRNAIFKQEYLRALKQFDYEKLPQLRQRAMARRWGSYTSDNKVSLNPKLIQTPREAIYYVCIHELCHKISKKHDQVFYMELKKRLPEWQRIKESMEIRYG